MSAMVMAPGNGQCVCDPGYEGDDCGILNAHSHEAASSWRARPNNLGAHDPDHNDAHSVSAVLAGASSGDATHASDANHKPG